MKGHTEAPPEGQRAASLTVSDRPFAGFVLPHLTDNHLREESRISDAKTTSSSQEDARINGCYAAINFQRKTTIINRMKSKVKTQRRSFDYLAIIGAIIWMSPSAFAKTCETGGCVVPSTVDCSTYGSIILEDSVSGIPVTHNALIGSAQMSNCGYNPITPYFSGTYLVNYAISESISHSASGTYTLSIGAKVGNEAVGQLGLNHSTTHSNGWQKQNAYTSSTSTSWNYQVPPHKIDGADYYGDWSDGTFTAGKYMRTWYFDDGTGSWENTECNNSSSTASGANKVYKNVHGVARSRQDC